MGHKVNMICQTPGHHQRARCKAARRDDPRCISHTPRGGTTEANAAGGALMVDQGPDPGLTKNQGVSMTEIQDFALSLLSSLLVIQLNTGKNNRFQ
jgi:hypothetical protein